LPDLRRLVRKLVVNSYWLQTQRPEPTAESAFLNLYDEIGFPLTVQIETLNPGAKSTIHNHGTWGIVAVLKGQAKNQFWQRSPQPEFPNKISAVKAQVLGPGMRDQFCPRSHSQCRSPGNRTVGDV
jgi:predicted metal-dependent enzyme (double-stranded beta helix superfamily)